MARWSGHRRRSTCRAAPTEIARLRCRQRRPRRESSACSHTPRRLPGGASICTKSGSSSQRCPSSEIHRRIRTGASATSLGCSSEPTIVSSMASPDVVVIRWEYLRSRPFGVMSSPGRTTSTSTQRRPSTDQRRRGRASVCALPRRRDEPVVGPSNRLDFVEPRVGGHDGAARGLVRSSTAPRCRAAVSSSLARRTPAHPAVPASPPADRRDEGQQEDRRNGQHDERRGQCRARSTDRSATRPVARGRRRRTIRLAPSSTRRSSLHVRPRSPPSPPWETVPLLEDRTTSAD